VWLSYDTLLRTQCISQNICLQPAAEPYNLLPSPTTQPVTTARAVLKTYAVSSASSRHTNGRSLNDLSHFKFCDGDWRTSSCLPYSYSPLRTGNRSDCRIGPPRWRPKKNHRHRHISVVLWLRVGRGGTFLWFLARGGDCDISVIMGCVGCCGEGRRWRNGRKVARKCREMNTGIRGTWCLGRECEKTVRWKEESSTNKNTKSRQLVLWLWFNVAAS